VLRTAVLNALQLLVAVLRLREVQTYLFVVDIGLRDGIESNMHLTMRPQIRHILSAFSRV
jgi:hypothetical protein